METTTKSNIAKAIIEVMKAVKGIEKNLTVGAGNASYKGVSDKDVKNIVGKAMQENGLCILPIAVDANTTVDRWEEENQYGKKSKQQVFTEVKTRYMLLHESGESIEVEGYGHGVDSQDKSAGKATTYALKYALLYSFLVPTGDIDDADTTHSENSEVPKKTAKTAIEEVNKASSLNQLTAIYNANQHLHADSSFMDALGKKKASLQPKKAA